MGNTNLVFVAGLGSTGSSAVCDLLSEFNCVHAPKEEWRIWVDPGCLLDLSRELAENSTLFTNTNAINNFNKNLIKISNRSFGLYSMLNHGKAVRQCIDNIRLEVTSEVKEVEYSGLWYGNSNIFTSKLNFLFKRKFWKSKKLNYKMTILKDYTDIDAYARLGHIVERNLLKLTNQKDKTHLVLNENFSILRADEIFKMHPEAKIVLTVRSPLDVYADSHRVGWLAMPYEIEKFIKWQNKMMKQISVLQNRYKNNILILSFEDLVLDYEATKNRIASFTGLSGSANTPLSKFDPKVSSINIDQWKKEFSWLSEYRDQFDLISLESSEK